MPLEVRVALPAGGLFFATALATGVWKSRWMLDGDEPTAPVYVDVAQRAALLYTFAALLLARLVEESPFSRTVNIVALTAPLAFFAIAIVTYIGLGARNDTDSQFRERNLGTTWGMAALILAEVSGF